MIEGLIIGYCVTAMIINRENWTALFWFSAIYMTHFAFKYW